MNFGAGWVCAPQFPLPKWPGACKSGFSLDEMRGDATWELHHPLQGPPNIWKPLQLWWCCGQDYSSCLSQLLFWGGFLCDYFQLVFFMFSWFFNVYFSNFILFVLVHIFQVEEGSGSECCDCMGCALLRGTECWALKNFEIPLISELIWLKAWSFHFNAFQRLSKQVSL